MPLVVVEHPPSVETDRLKLLLLREGYKVAQVQGGPGLAGRLDGLKPAGILILASAPRDTLEALRSARSCAARNRPAIFCVHLSPWPQGAVDCLEAGADDFLCKPFNPNIFLARTRALIRRRHWGEMAAHKRDPDAQLENGAVRLNLLTRQVFVSDKPLALTRLEFDLLAHFMRTHNSVLSRQAILQAVWKHPEDVEVDTRTVDKHVESLRAKLDKAGRMIKTSRGNGYFFQPDPLPARS